MASIQKAVLLAGGESTRFAPFSEKNTWKFLGKPFLYWHFAQLKRIGITDVVVVTNAGNESEIQAIEQPKGMHVTYVCQTHPGQVYAIVALEQKCGDEPIVILNASDYYQDSVIDAIVKKANQSDHAIILGAIQTDRYFPGGYLKFDAKKMVTAIIEKPKQGEEPSDIVRILADVVPDAKTFIDACKKCSDNAASGYEEALTKLIQADTPTHAEIVPSSSWLPMKYPWHVLDVTAQLLLELDGQKIDKSVVIKSNVIIEGPVVIEEGVKIFEGTKIVGPCYIGKRTIIGNNNIIRSSAIGDDCVTGFNTDITRSTIGNSCWFHSNYIGDSVLADDISLGSGTVLANLRLDDGEIPTIVKGEKILTGRNKLGALIASHVRIGVNTSTMPGVKIGSGSFVGAGIVLGKDLAEKQFCAATVAYTIKDNTATPAVSRETFRKGL